MNTIKTVLLVLLLCSGCQPSYKQYISKQLQIPIQNNSAITYQDDRGWFGDGEIYSVLTFPNNNIEKDIQQSSFFHLLPFPSNIQSFLQSHTNHENFLQIKQGYWYFYDRHDKSQDAYSDKDFLNRYSHNITLALYDTQKHKLYYLELNT